VMLAWFSACVVVFLLSLCSCSPVVFLFSLCYFVCCVPSSSLRSFVCVLFLLSRCVPSFVVFLISRSVPSCVVFLLSSCSFVCCVPALKEFLVRCAPALFASHRAFSFCSCCVLHDYTVVFLSTLCFFALFQQALCFALSTFDYFAHLFRTRWQTAQRPWRARTAAGPQTAAAAAGAVLNPAQLPRIGTSRCV
jgi:hypothetical protein